MAPAVFTLETNVYRLGSIQTFTTKQSLVTKDRINVNYTLFVIK